MIFRGLCKKPLAAYLLLKAAKVFSHNPLILQIKIKKNSVLPKLSFIAGRSGGALRQPPEHTDASCFIALLHPEAIAFAVRAFDELVGFVKVGDFHVWSIPQQFDIAAGIFHSTVGLFLLDIIAADGEITH